MTVREGMGEGPHSLSLSLSLSLADVEPMRARLYVTYLPKAAGALLLFATNVAAIIATWYVRPVGCWTKPADQWRRSTGPPQAGSAEPIPAGDLG